MLEKSSHAPLLNAPSTKARLVTVEQQQLTPDMQNYLRLLAEKAPFVKDSIIDSRTVTMELKKFWPQIRGKKIQAAALWKQIEDIVRAIPTVEPAPTILLRIAVKASPIHPGALPEPYESAVIASFDIDEGILRRYVIPLSDEAQISNDMGIPCGLVVVCQPMIPLMNPAEDIHTLKVRPDNLYSPRARDKLQTSDAAAEEEEANKRNTIPLTLTPVEKAFRFANTPREILDPMFNLAFTNTVAKKYPFENLFAYTIAATGMIKTIEEKNQLDKKELGAKEMKQKILSRTNKINVPAPMISAKPMTAVKNKNIPKKPAANSIFMLAPLLITPVFTRRPRVNKNQVKIQSTPAIIQKRPSTEYAQTIAPISPPIVTGVMAVTPSQRIAMQEKLAKSVVDAESEVTTGESPQPIRAKPIPIMKKYPENAQPVHGIIAQPVRTISDNTSIAASPSVTTDQATQPLSVTVQEPTKPDNQTMLRQAEQPIPTVYTPHHENIGDAAKPGARERNQTLTQPVTETNGPDEQKRTEPQARSTEIPIQARDNNDREFLQEHMPPEMLHTVSKEPQESSRVVKESLHQVKEQYEDVKAAYSNTKFDPSHELLHHSFTAENKTGQSFHDKMTINPEIRDHPKDFTVPFHHHLGGYDMGTTLYVPHGGHVTSQVGIDTGSVAKNIYKGVENTFGLMLVHARHNLSAGNTGADGTKRDIKKPAMTKEGNRPSERLRPVQKSSESPSIKQTWPSEHIHPIAELKE